MNNKQQNAIYDLARIVLPGPEHESFRELFERTHHNKRVFNTWMNTFAAQKYATYCELGEIYLKIQARGIYRLEVMGSKREAGRAPEDIIIISEEKQDDVCVHIPNASEYDAVFFFIIQNPDAPVELLGGAWCTDKAPLRQNKLAIVSCTYKREEFITRNVALFEQYLKDTPDMQGRMKLFIVDNGKTLPESIKSHNVELYPNMNAGGAGGFTRGLLEIRAKNDGYTRVLFMDDDVEVFPESFFRTLILADYLKPEKKQAFINGAMLDMYEKNKFFENLALQEGLWVRPFHGPCDLSYENIMRVNKIPEEVFHNPDVKTDSAWWYSCFDMELVEEKGLPLPVFFRGDDLEWGWRNFGNTHISLNGICIWHAPFVFRVSKAADYYYLPRNMFMIHTIYTPSFKNWWKDMYHSYRKYLSKTYNYAGMEMFAMALQDILKGAEAYKENPAEQLKRVNAANEVACCKKCYNPEEMEKALHPRPFKLRKIRKWLYKITDKGQYCPSPLMKKKRNVPDWYPPTQAFAMVRTVNLYNPLKQHYEVRKFDFSQNIYYQKLIKQLINQIEQRYDELHEAFILAHKEFTTEAFWRKYLELND